MKNIDSILKLFNSLSNKDKESSSENVELISLIDKFSTNKLSQKDAKNILSILKDLNSTSKSKTSQELPPPSVFDFFSGPFEELFEEEFDLSISTSLELSITNPSSGLSILRVFPINLRFFTLLVIFSFATGAIKFENDGNDEIIMDPEDLKTMYDIISKYMPEENQDEKPFKITRKRRGK